MFRLVLVVWLRLWWFVKKHTGANLVGLGFALRQCWFDFEFIAGGRRFFFNHKIASAYCLLPAGLWNEPETHLFLHRALSAFPGLITFVDVGASVGEMVMDLAGHPKVCEVIAFEPQPHAAQAIRKSLQLNGFAHVRVIESAVAGKAGTVYFEVNGSSSTAGHVSEGEQNEHTPFPVRCTTLDLELQNIDVPIVILIDVEGHELDVLKGAMGVIQKNRPLIIFEYNDITRQFFDLKQVAALLGQSWQIYRLRGDGLLDTDFTKVWNCVAVPAGSPFQYIGEMAVKGP
jgi:FkbM family methyltransferase